MGVVDGGAQHSELAAGRAIRTAARRDVKLTDLFGDLGNGAFLPERREGVYCITDARGCLRLGTMLFGVIGKHVGHEHFSGITRPGAAGSHVEESGKGDFSLFAICRARAALPTAAAFGPGDVITSTLIEEAEPRP